MTRMSALLALACAIGTSLHAQSSTTTPAPQSGPVAQLFAPGIISGPGNDGTPTFSPDGSELFFTRSAAHWSVILESHRTGGGWSTPVVAPFSGQWPDSSPAWSPDGRFILFQSIRPKQMDHAESAPPATPTYVSNIWRADRTPTGWSDPVRLPDAVNFTGSIWKPSIAANGNIYITVIGPGSGSGPAKSIYMSELKQGVYQPAKPLPFSDGAKLDVDPEIAPDESFLVFSSAGRLAGDPHERLYLVKRVGGNWGEPKIIRYRDDVSKYGASTDNEPKLARDGSTLYFSTDRTIVTHFPRTRAQATEDLKRLDEWDNSNSNIWSISLKDALAD